MAASQSGPSKAVQKVLGRIPIDDLTAAQRLEVALEAAAIFVKRGNRSSGLTPISTRYGGIDDYYYVDPSIVRYEEPLSATTKVFEVVSTGRSATLFVTASGHFALERAEYWGEDVWPFIEGKIRRRQPATNVTVGDATEWLLEALGQEKSLLASIVATLLHEKSRHADKQEGYLNEERSAQMALWLIARALRPGWDGPAPGVNSQPGLPIFDWASGSYRFYFDNHADLRRLREAVSPIVEPTGDKRGRWYLSVHGDGNLISTVDPRIATLILSTASLLDIRVVADPYIPPLAA